MAIRFEKLSDTVWALSNDNTLLAEINGDTINIRGTMKMGSDLVSPSATELAAINGMTATSTELNFVAGVAAGTVTASKALVVGANKEVDTLSIADSGLKLGAGAGTAVTKTAATINALVGGVAGGYLIARSAAPLALDASNPTSAAHGLTTCVAAFAQLVGSAAPGDSTSILTVVINGANLDFYAWKHTTGGAAGNPTLVASTGTETFNWFAIGT